MAGRSRYWLRMQADENRFSTVEALLCVLERFGRTAERDALRLQFEMHVYATLRARGAKDLALEFLATSPIREEFASVIAALDVPRPR
jgi:DTW domain-containing protein YfiP